MSTPILSTVAQALRPPMMYRLYDFQRRVLEPLAAHADVSAHALSEKTNPFAHWPNVRLVVANQSLFHRLAKRYEKLPWGIDTVAFEGTTTVSVAEEVVVSEPFCRLVHFVRRSENADVAARLEKNPKVLLCAPLSGHHATLLRETVRMLLADHDVYVTDWCDARDVPLSEGEFHLDDYVHTLMRYMRLLDTGSLHVVAVCQPTVPAVAAVSLLAQAGEATPQTLTLMGGPVDARKSPTSVNLLATQHPFSWFEKNMIHKVPGGHAGKGRRVYPGFMQLAAFVMMNPKNHLKSYFHYWTDTLKGDSSAKSRKTHEKFYDEYNSVLDMDAGYYLETVRTVFQDFALAKGTWNVRGIRVRPDAIATTALFTVEGEKDDISGLGQTEAAHDLCSSIPDEKRKHYVAVGAGHYGIFSGRRWREQVYPELKQFIEAHRTAGGSAESC